LICLVPCLVAGYATVYALQTNKFRLGIDLAGGTILVYEVNLERTNLRKETEKGTKEKEKDAANKDKDKEKTGLSPNEMAQLAAQIKRRIDPTDIKNLTVRPLGDRRVEIILPTGGSSGGRAGISSQEVTEMKQLISQMGVL